MQTVAELLRQRIEALGFTDIKECARAYELPYELLRKVISAGHIPKDKTLTFYAEQLGMDATELLTAAYRQRAPQTMHHLFEPRAPVERPAPPVAAELQGRTAPVLGVAACGPWLESFAVEPDQYEPVDLRDPDAFFVTAEGDSMTGGNIAPGSLLLVSPAAGVSNGQIVLARRGEEEFTVKTYFRKGDGTTILQPLNPAYEPIIVSAEEPLSVMRVIEVRTKL